MDIELATIQSWIEGADTDLYGQNGDPGMIRLFWADRAAREQRDKDRCEMMDGIHIFCFSKMFIVDGFSLR